MTMKSLKLTCIKYFLFTFNLISTLFGLTIITFGVLNFTAHLGSIKISHFLYILPFALILIGAVMFKISFFGCCGALLENRCMIITFAGLIIILFIAEILGGIALYSFYNEDALNEDLHISLMHYFTDKDIRHFWDTVNYNLQCCGVSSRSDWGDSIPHSCCKDIDVNDVCHKEQAYETGCFHEMLRFLKFISPAFFSAVLLFQLVGIILGLCLDCRNNYETV